MREEDNPKTWLQFSRLVYFTPLTTLWSLPGTCLCFVRWNCYCCLADLSNDEPGTNLPTQATTQNQLVFARKPDRDPVADKPDVKLYLVGKLANLAQANPGMVSRLITVHVGECTFKNLWDHRFCAFSKGKERLKSLWCIVFWRFLTLAPRTPLLRCLLTACHTSAPWAWF